MQIEATIMFMFRINIVYSKIKVIIFQNVIVVTLFSFCKFS